MALHREVTVGAAHTRRARLALAVTLGALAILIATVHGRAGAGATMHLDAVFDSIAGFSGDPAPDTVDLRDGRSRVPARWQERFERFAQSDRAHSQAPGGIVFTGSSSIDFWSDLPAQFPDHHVVQRGLPGATIVDCLRHADRLILPYRPRVIVFYAGDNDLAAGVTPEQVVADYAAFVRRVHRELPATKIVFVSIKPSPARTALMPLIVRTNRLVAAYTGTDGQLDFVNVHDAMLDRDAQVRRELFGADGLHMTPAGYALWRDAIADRLH